MTNQVTNQGLVMLITAIIAIAAWEYGKRKKK